MTTVFPGIDPYLEAQGYWRFLCEDDHLFLRCPCRTACPILYMVRIEERIHLIERSSGDVKLMRPDVLIELAPGFSGARSSAVSIAVEVEPATVPLTIQEEVRETYLEILHRSERPLVAVIELFARQQCPEPGFGHMLRPSETP